MGVRNLRTDYGRGKGEEGEYSWIAGAPQSEELLKTLEELDLEGERDDELGLCFSMCAEGRASSQSSRPQAWP